MTANQGVPASDALNNVATFTKTYNSFSGVDMVVTFGGKVIGELQGISYTIQREKAPVYTMGSADPRSFSRGKRGIAGSVVFHVFDRSALLEAFRDTPYIANKYDITAGFALADIEVPTVEIASGLIGTTDGSANPGITRITIDKVLAKPMYLDQVLPFEVVITASNEYGSFAKMAIHGVEILNCGSGMSIDDITTDEACTFVATRVTPWNSQGFIRAKKGGVSTEITG
jgi:hypothetical protein